MNFISKKFVERRAYSALFDPAGSDKRQPKWHKCERVKSRRPTDWANIEARALANDTPPTPGQDTGRVKREPWYKKKKLT